ncbi:SURF1 family protein [Aurantiacibacter sp. D1-12]|uniref:SURF1 family protein n=1 Tax=Aurantiacibacter sp. D1-12 TaxID=2993658 RepID=UPI00237CF2F1|nr:SURF1 family protein [Aurantiacibacter sp. D1-12]MDE1467857.1 SURF1 family protein [Aurantiacibacter sp. D1-12]
MSTRKIPIIPTIVVVAAAAVMVALGMWQLGRADEKEVLIARYEAASQLPPAELTNLRDAEDLLFRRVSVDCTNADRWEAVAGRSLSGQTGYVHRYWCLGQSVRRHEHGGNGHLNLFATIGWSRAPQDPVWEGGTLEGVLAPLGDNFKLVSDSGLADLETAAVPDPSDMPNNHLAYAGQWFFFALTALLIYGFALRRRWRDQG